jgi:Uma2 family endonuclease
VRQFVRSRANLNRPCARREAQLWFDFPMTELPKRQLTADEFLGWALRQPQEGGGKFELADGVVMQQQPERAVHWEIKLALAVAFLGAIKRRNLSCFAAVDGPTVRIHEKKVCQPDGLVYCGERVPPDVLEVNTPVIVWEVLSPDSVERDHGDKLDAYFTLASLHHYLIVDPTSRSITHHRRGQEDELVTRVRKSGRLTFNPPVFEIEIADVFERP